uniref:SFRICE_028109 n=1 Tax=Spodoptera frugiperda TaxID=7108 RepID=A0A2H1WCE8_SPOFR
MEKSSTTSRLRDVAASAHAAHDEESLCDSKLVELFSINCTLHLTRCASKAGVERMHTFTQGVVVAVGDHTGRRGRTFYMKLTAEYLDTRYQHQSTEVSAPLGPMCGSVICQNNTGRYYKKTYIHNFTPVSHGGSQETMKAI